MKRNINLQLFFTPNTDPGSYEVNPVNTTSNFSVSMKDFYDTSLLENAREAMVFTQLGKKQPMKGKTCEWRKFNTFANALTPLTEGVIPTGHNFGMTSISVTTQQYGDYTAITDRLEMEAYDDIIFGASEEMGAAEGNTFDILTRNVLVAGNSVAYCPKVSGSTVTAVTSRTDLDNTALLTPVEISKANTWLKKSKAPKYDGQTYAAVIHPSVAFDLRNSEEWKEFHKYADVSPIFKGEIGTLHGVRFIESNNAKVWNGADLTEASRNLTVKTAATTTATIAVKEAISADEATALANRKLIDASGNVYKIASATAGTTGSAVITLAEATSIAANAVLYPGEGGAAGNAVYATLVMGKDSFGVLDPEGEGMEMIIKSKGEVGGPLEQFSTVGYKFCHAAKILYQERLLRIESGSSYGTTDEEN